MSRSLVWIGFVAFAIWLLTMDVEPQMAQFATVTPPGQPVAPAPLAFATNTPEGANAASEVVAPIATEQSAVVRPPDNLFNVSLRLWLEDDLVDLALQQIRMIESADSEQALALQVTLYELQRRYAGAPSSMEQRREMIDAMLAAPVGAIDMRSIVRPLIESEINLLPDAASLSVGAFTVQLQQANLDNRGAADAVVQITATVNGELRYDEYVLALGTGTGFRFLDTNYNLFAVPFDGLQSVVLEQIADVNQDSLDEVVLRVDDGQLNQRLLILGARNETAINLVDPNDDIRLTEIASWPVAAGMSGAPLLSVIESRAESRAPDWECTSQQAFNWAYDRNLYRRSVGDLNSRFQMVDSIGCDLLAQEPLFAQDPAVAITLIEEALMDYGLDAPGLERALAVLAMQYILAGRLDDARATAEPLLSNAEVGSWMFQQTNAMLNGLGASGNTALDICEIVAAKGEAPACDIDAVLGRYLASIPFTTDEDLVAQLERIGLAVAEQSVVRAVGFADRTVIRFDIINTGWWGFVGQRDGTYLVERAEAPADLETSAAPDTTLTTPVAAYDALFLDDNPASALNVITSLQDDASQPLPADALFLMALSYDLTAAREEARVAYFNTWSRYPDSVWGQLAAQHLELR